MFVIKSTFVVFGHVYEECQSFFLNNWNSFEVTCNGLKLKHT